MSSNIALKDSVSYEKGTTNSFKTSNDSKSSGLTSVSKNDINISVRSINESQNLFKEEDLSRMLKTQKGKESFAEVVDVANKVLFGTDSHFQFEMHDKTGRVMVKVISTETDKVIKEFPPEKLLNAVAGLWELAGIIVDEKV